jgi:hypothetical protein
MTLDFNLPTQLMFNPSLEQLTFVQDFDGHNILAGFFSGEVYGTKLATAQWLANLKVVQAPLLSSLSSVCHIIGITSRWLGGSEFLKRPFQRLFPGLLVRAILLVKYL